MLGVLALVALTPLATSVWRIIDINREALATATQEYQLLLARSTAEKTDFEIDAVAMNLEQVARSLDLGSCTQSQDALTRLVENNPIRYVRYVGPECRDGSSISAGQPLFHMSEFHRFVVDTVNSVASDQVVLSRPILTEKPESVSTLLVSVPVDPEIKSRLAAVVDLDAIWESVTEHHHGGSTVYLLDDSGTVFASTDAARIRPGDDMSRSEMIERVFSGHGLARGTLPHTEWSDGVATRYLGSYDMTALGWAILVRSDLNLAYAPIRVLINETVKWMLIALVFSGLIGIGFAMSLSKPINQLAAASRAFARGEFSLRVKVRSSNELGELADTFNGMAGAIETQMAELRSAASENRELFDGTILALAKAIDAKDEYTRGHSMRVNEYSLIIARQLDLGPRETRDLHVSSLLHDVGKIGIDDAILKKPGRLSPEEYDVIKSHTVIGAAIMASIPQMKDILPGLRWHHERLDGSGYPDGLRGMQIPLMARIIAVADTFDAVTSSRSYQRTRNFDEGMELLLQLEALDAGLVEAFHRAYCVGEVHAVASRSQEDALEPAQV